MVRFALTPPAPKKPPWEPCAAQLALARAHPGLVPLARVPNGYEPCLNPEQRWFELAPGRGFAGYGLARALRMLLDLLGSLGELHETKTNLGAPFVHGEVCPSLLRVDDSGVTRLVPLAPWHWSKAGTLAAQDRVGHLAPERLLGDALDHRADVFSCGVLLWEALAGRRLFEDEGVDTIITRLMGGKVQLPALPPELSWALPLKPIAECALSVDPEQRFANCAELSAALEAVAGQQIAGHAEVAAYFSAPHRSVPAPDQAPPHNSSLSALTSAIESEQTPRLEVRVQSSPGHTSTAPEARASARSRAPLLAALVVSAALGLALLARSPAATPQAPVAGAAAPLARSSGTAASVSPSSALGVPAAAASALQPPVTALAPEAAATIRGPARVAPRAGAPTNSAPTPPKSVKIQRPIRGAPAPARSKAPQSVPRASDAELYGI